MTAAENNKSAYRMSKVMIKDSHHFEISVPYELIETGSTGKKPLIVYLHGYKQNLVRFKEKVAPLLDIEAYHLFLQGPYIIYDEKHRRDITDWGRAWYLYDGNQQRFKESLERGACYIQEIIDEVCPEIKRSKTILVGYSMGGYQAGYFALSRPDYVDDLIVAGGRIKFELFSGQTFPNLNVLVLHGIDDASVDFQVVADSVEELRRMEAEVVFCELGETHRLTLPYISKIKQWLEKR